MSLSESSSDEIVPDSAPSELPNLSKALELESCPYSLSDGDSNQTEVVSWLLSRLRDRSYEIAQKDDQLVSLRGEVNYAQNRAEILAREKDKALTLSARFQEQERKATQQNQNVTSRYKQSCDELARHKSQSLHLQSQFVHEARKRERESQRLKERLEQILSDKSKDEKRSLEVLNALKKSRVETGRAKWNVEGKGEVEMYQGVIQQYEEQQRELVSVIESLRQDLLDTDSELSSLLSLSSPQPSPSPSPCPVPLPQQEQWGPLLREKFEALREKLKGFAADRLDKSEVLNHSFTGADPVLNSLPIDS